MALPIILAVEDEPDVLRDLERDIAKRSSADYQVLTSESPQRGLERLAAAQREKAEVAIVIASQRMSSMSGIDFLVRAHELHPLARRALLIRVADTDAIPVMEQAFTLNRLDSYLTKPWEPADEWLYPPLADLLREWVRASEAGPRSTVIQLIGDLWEPRCYRLKDLLDRNGLPYAFYTSNSEHGREVLASVGRDGQKLPVLVVNDGRRTQCFVDPDPREVAPVLGADIRPRVDACDVLIAGAGPAGFAAAVYAASEGLSTLVIEAEAVGGPGGLPVLVAGAGNSAGQTAVHLAQYAESVTIVAPDPSLSAHMSDYLVRQVQATPRIKLRLRTEIVDAVGGQRLEGLILRSLDDGTTETVPAAALFVMIGAQPSTDWLAPAVLRDAGGYILTGQDVLQDGAPPAARPPRRPPLPREANLPGVLAAGDVRH